MEKESGIRLDKKELRLELRVDQKLQKKDKFLIGQNQLGLEQDKFLIGQNELGLEQEDKLLIGQKQLGLEQEEVLLTDLNSRSAEEVDELELTNSHVGRPRFAALDGGYGWFVVLGCFISHVVFGGFDRSEGILFLLLTAKFQQGAQLTSWPGAVACTLQLLLGPLANALSSRYSHRLSVMVGAVLMFLGTLLSSFSPNFAFYFVFHGVVDGVGRGIAYVPGLVMVGNYFDKRAGLAVGLATAGTGLGTFVIVPLTQYLADNFGFQGTFLILTGIACHMFIAALLYRPLSLHHRSIHTVRRLTRQKQVVLLTSTIHEPETNHLDMHTTTTRGSGIQFAQTVAGYEHARASYASNKEVSCSQPCRLHQPVKIYESRFNDDDDREDNCFIQSLQVCLPVDPNNKQSQQCCSFRLLSNPSFLMFCLSIFTFTMAFRAAFTFIPALIESKGISKSEAALALSAAGAVDTLGRVGTGFILDLPRLRPFRLVLYNLFIFTVGLLACLLPLVTSLAMFCVTCAMYGLMTGAYISQKSVVLADILDPENFASSLGILMVFQGLGGLFGPPLAGALRDTFGRYDESFYFGGVLLVLSGLLMVLCNVFKLFLARNICCQKYKF